MYLKRFMPVTWKKKENEITINFQAIIPNDKDLKHLEDRIGKGFALCIYKMVQRSIAKRKSKAALPPPNYGFPEGERLVTFSHTIALEYPWVKDRDHITSLVILHNPAADSDSMVTSDAPMLP